MIFMKRRNRPAALCIAAIMSFGFLSAVPADTYALANSTVYSAGSFSKSDIDLMNMIKEMIENYDTSIVDISDYNVSTDELWILYGTVVYNEPSLFQVSNTNLYVDYETEDHVTLLRLDFRFSEKMTASMQKEIDSFTDTLMEGIQQEWSDAEKVLYVHDYITSRSDYYEGKSLLKGRNIYDTFINGTSVCVGYSLGFQYIMDKLGIPCICITSDTHVWNMVQIDSNWYHVDLTWDDSEPISQNLVFHNMLLLSEYALDNYYEPHEPYDYAMAADSSKYDDFFWKDSVSRMVYSNGKWYYTTTAGLCRYDFKTGKAETVHKFTKNELWKTADGKEWLISFGQLCEYGGNIYFNSSNKLYRFSPSTGKTSVIAKPDLPDGCLLYDLSVDSSGIITVYGGKSIDNTSEVSFKYNVSSADAAAKDKSSEKNDAPVVSDSGNVRTVSWSASDDAEQYIVYRYDKSDKKIVQIAVTVDTKISFKKSSADDNCLYAVKVRTADGLSDYSKWA